MVMMSESLFSSSSSVFLTQDIHLESTVQDLPLYSFQVDIEEPGIALTRIFETHPFIPGVILTDRGKFVGMISQRRFLKMLSRPYGRELFLNRCIRLLHRFVTDQMLILSGNTPILEAANRAVQRDPEKLYEPIVVRLFPEEYQVLDTQQLLLAQSYLHQLATQLLHEKTQAQLIQTEKLVLLGQMVAGLAHELRNPLNCISGNARFIQESYDAVLTVLDAYEQKFPNSGKEIERLKEHFDLEFVKQDFPDLIKSIQVSSERMNQLVSSLRSFSYMDDSSKQETDIHECLDSTLLILKNRLKLAGIEVVKNYADLPPIPCYPGQLSQVFMNLIVNGIDALEERMKTDWNELPQIEIRTQIKPLSDQHFKFYNRLSKEELNFPINLFERTKDYLSIKIIDNALGIPPEIKAKIFDNFFTTKPIGKGTGLGLAISYQIIVEKHGGKLILNSTPGEGTEFEIILPLDNQKLLD
ncbi:sensor histidine kinase [Capilliphycus salinus ALCB114379]|uniref:sensor histidine kinase n=1 Tax=Capilliphycus salinus TaxID=2768948 RepID=UPI0039A67E40